MQAAWARGLRDQCVDAGVPFFFKQWGEWLPTRFREDGSLIYARRGLVGTYLIGLAKKPRCAFGNRGDLMLRSG